MRILHGPKKKKKRHDGTRADVRGSATKKRGETISVPPAGRREGKEKKRSNLSAGVLSPGPQKERKKQGQTTTNKTNGKQGETEKKIHHFVLASLGRRERKRKEAGCDRPLEGPGERNGPPAGPTDGAEKRGRRVHPPQFVKRKERRQRLRVTGLTNKEDAHRAYSTA